MDTSNHTFLFSPPNNKLPSTSHRVHLRRLYDVLQLSIQRGDIERARRAWAILTRCKEIDWKTSWTLSVGLLDRFGHRTESSLEKIDYLRTMMLQLPEEKEQILSELVHLYILAGRHKEALDELEFSLPSFPYRDNAVLHIYAGICYVFAAQSSAGGFAGEDDIQRLDNEMFDRAQIFFERAKSLDPDNVVVDSLLNMVSISFETSSTQANQPWRPRALRKGPPPRSKNPTRKPTHRFHQNMLRLRSRALRCLSCVGHL
ncbi:hypothetical protein PAXRUDRAFT_793637 [Paxillus rubicundulus Ve08.2h10]|uniref:Unplaced genomic scaffold scaffold_472, whole genome shotgun sequence n=1 Tax=Paxillus rubicundulus Ve08.2h10 TaxID=930991 RepID=A0A0D0DZA1_9AGAM|nr:hypothetical protein PAXRUDRAFT_793637 [Paxillus rubicundulus Ve08.2h10]